jgi:hypothetical protein
MKKFKKSNNAVVGIVAAFLIVGLVVAVLSVIQTQYVPKWMTEKESDHMDELADQFAKLNYAINTHVINKVPNIPISTTITLGSKEMPYLMSVKAFGQLKILPNNFILNVSGDTYYEESFGTIEYNSFNSYFIDQDYIYECGGVILSQDSGSAMYIRPNFDVLLQTDIAITLNVVNISTIGGKSQSVQGSGPAPIQTEYITSSTNQIIIKNVSYINITSNRIQTWDSYLNSKFRINGLNHPGFVDYEVMPTDDENKLVIHFLMDTKVIINYVEIGAQIAPGWVEDR